MGLPSARRDRSRTLARPLQSRGRGPPSRGGIHSSSPLFCAASGTHRLLSRHPDASTATLAEVIRGHWEIENRLYYMLDTALGEDASRIRKNPGIFAHLRHLELNLLSQNGQS